MLKFEVSQAKLEDAELLLKHRLSMFNDMSPELRAEIELSKAHTRQWIEKMLSADRLIGFIVRTEEGQVVGSGCIWLKGEQPRPTSSHLEGPYLLSMYTEKEFRRRGVARLIVKCAIAWCKKRGYDRITFTRLTLEKDCMKHWVSNQQMK